MKNIFDLNVGIVGDGITDDTIAIRLALSILEDTGGTLFFPAGEYLISSTIVVPQDVTIMGEGRTSLWDDEELGTVFRTIGAGNPQKWTDIFDADASLETPVFVAGSNGVWFKDFSIFTDSWSIGLFFPTVRGCGFSNIAGEGFSNSPVYLDVTWGPDNSTLNSLHPDVSSNGGMNEFSGENFILQGDGPGLKIQGTTRNPATVTPWVWGVGGCSDVMFSKGRCTGISIDGAVNNAAGVIQGIRFFGVDPRVGSRTNMINIDRANRVEFYSGYGEGTSGYTSRVSFTSRTGSVSFFGGRYIRNTVWYDGVDTGVGLMAGYHAEMNDRLTCFGHDGFNQISGSIYTNGFSVIPGATISSQSVRPSATGSFNLGTGSYKWNTVHTNSVSQGSDERIKNSISSIDKRVLKAWEKVDFVQYRMNGCGDQIRFGAIAQRIIEAFESEGLNPFDFGIVTHDSWPDEYDGEVLIRKAGDMYSVNYTEALVLECAINRRKGF